MDPDDSDTIDVTNQTISSTSILNKNQDSLKAHKHNPFVGTQVNTTLN